MNKLNYNNVLKSQEKLSSGLRINSAADDAAGLAISEKMRAQIRGLDRASRNIQDSISLIQTAEGGLSEIHELLQRGRELSVEAANDTLTQSDREHIQLEVNEIVEEVDRIANATQFNTINLLNKASSTSSSEQTAIMDALKKSWLYQSEELISNALGLTADGAPLEIQFISNSGDGKVAWVQGSYFASGSDGRYFNQKLVVDMSDFTPISWPNGGGSWISNDRIIAHEMVHAVMGRTTNFRDLPTWLKEGIAEFVPGADERLSIDLAIAGSDTTLKNEIDTWDQESADYSAAYWAVKYLDAQVVANGGNGIEDIINDIKLATLGGNEKTFDQAIADNTTFNGITDFLADFKANATLANSNITLGDESTDVGGFISGDDGAAVPDGIAPTYAGTPDNPLAGFTEIWPSVSEGLSSQPLNIHIGANSSQNIKLNLINATSAALGINNIDLANISGGDGGPIDLFDAAILSVSSFRARLGATQNRLEHALNITDNYGEQLQTSESRIRDLDMAKEMMNMTKSNILQQAAQTMLAQGSQKRQMVLQLLQ